MVLECCSKLCSSCFAADVVEAVGLKEVLSWILMKGLSKVKVEMSAKLVVDAFHTRENCLSEFGVLILKCLSLFDLKLDISVSFVKRSANCEAHALAKATHFHANPMYW